MQDLDLINVGEISGVFGVKGWLKIYSFTQPRENILQYTDWYLQKGSQRKTVKLIDGKRQGKLVVVAVEGVQDRDDAALLSGWQILIDRKQLPEPEQGEYYWADLVGLSVETQNGEALGLVDHLLETGANDVLVVKDAERERLIPFLQEQTIVEIDLDAKLLVVDWDPDF